MLNHNLICTGSTEIYSRLYTKLVPILALYQVYSKVTGWLPRPWQRASYLVGETIFNPFFRPPPWNATGIVGTLAGGRASYFCARKVANFARVEFVRPRYLLARGIKSYVNFSQLFLLLLQTQT